MIGMRSISQMTSRVSLVRADDPRTMTESRGVVTAYVDVEEPLRLELQLVVALNAAEPGLYEREGCWSVAVSRNMLRTAT